MKKNRESHLVPDCCTIYFIFQSSKPGRAGALSFLFPRFGSKPMEGLDGSGQGRKACNSCVCTCTRLAGSVDPFPLFSSFSSRSLGAVCFRFRPRSWSACVFRRHRPGFVVASLRLVYICFLFSAVPLASALGTNWTNNRRRLADELIAGVCLETDGSVARHPTLSPTDYGATLWPCSRNNNKTSSCTASARRTKEMLTSSSLSLSAFLFFLIHYGFLSCVWVRAYISLARGWRCAAVIKMAISLEALLPPPPCNIDCIKVPSIHLSCPRLLLLLRSKS